MEILNANDKLFQEATGTGYDYATIDSSKDISNSNGLLLLVEGYRNAAYMLLRELTQNHGRDRLKIDSLIYPALYLYRHYLEIIMKDTLRYHRLLSGEINNDQVGFESVHSLLDLWKKLRPYLDLTYSHETDSPLTHNTVEGLLSELDTKDQGSYAFRYPFVRNTKITGFAKPSLADFSIDLRNLEDVCQRLSHYFEGVNQHAVVLLDNKYDLINDNY